MKFTLTAFPWGELITSTSDLSGVEVFFGKCQTAPSRLSGDNFSEGQSEGPVQNGPEIMFKRLLFPMMDRRNPERLLGHKIIQGYCGLCENLLLWKWYPVPFARQF
jgi:hypothetical protein